MRVKTLSASTISGNDVKNSKGEHLGHIKDIMINLEDGRIAYAVLSFGGFLGMGDKLFAISWNSIRVDQVDKCCVLNVSKERLENAPGFDKDDWPKTGDPAYLTRVYEYYKAEPFWKQPETV